MNHNIAALRRHYSTLTDDKIQSLVDKDVLSLTPEGLQVLKEEIVKRNLPLLGMIDDALTHEEYIKELILSKCNEIREQPCPICKGEEYKLNAVWLTTVTSFLTTQVKKEFHIGCYNCLMKLKQSAEDRTSLLGWWGIWGVFETPKALKANDIAAAELTHDKPSTGLWNHVSDIVRRWQ